MMDGRGNSRPRDQQGPRLRLSPTAAIQLGALAAGALPAPDPERARAAEEARAEAKRLARLEADRVAEANREALKQQRAEAAESDVGLRGALDRFHALVAASRPAACEGLEREVAVARRRAQDAQDALDRARQAHETATADLARVEGDLRAAEERVSHAQEDITAARILLNARYRANEDIWQRVNSAYRKANRDRKLKAEVRDVLGIKE